MSHPVSITSEPIPVGGTGGGMGSSTLGGGSMTTPFASQPTQPMPVGGARLMDPHEYPQFPELLPCLGLCCIMSSCYVIFLEFSLFLFH
jgi:hypothetical protein